MSLIRTYNSQSNDGTITAYSYDVLNRLTGISYPDGTGEAFTYDVLSRINTAVNETSTVTYSYNNRGRVSSVTDVWGYKIDYGYDYAGNKETVNVSSNQTTLYEMNYGYDNMNRPTSQTDTVNSAAYVYDATGKLTSRTLNNAFTASYDYNNLYDGIGTNLGAGGTLPPQGIQYVYDDNGNLVMRTDANKPSSNKNIQYKYDALGRLVARIDGTQWTWYTYGGEDVIVDTRSDGSRVYYGNAPGIDNKLWYTEEYNNLSSTVFFLTDHQGTETLIDYFLF